jgi:hypothetical protein
MQNPEDFLELLPATHLLDTMTSPMNDELSRSLRDVIDSTQLPQEFLAEPIIEERIVEVFVPVYEKEIVEVPQVRSECNLLVPI